MDNLDSMEYFLCCRWQGDHDYVKQEHRCFKDAVKADEEQEILCICKIIQDREQHEVLLGLEYGKVNKDH